MEALRHHGNDDVVAGRYETAIAIPHLPRQYRMLIPIPDAKDARILDLEYLGQTEYLAALLLDTSDGLAVVDPGPTTTLEMLMAAVRELAGNENALRHVLMTHIHLDHGGCAGVITERLPQATVYVHERGAPHVVDPSRLMASATRLYGDRMQELWGDVRPVPADRLRVVRDNDRLTLGGRVVDVAYTPGHAIHHVSYLDRVTGLAYVGDAAGERFHSGTPVIPTTPPPDIDLEAWATSVERLRGWKPSALVLSHFGAFNDAEHHLAEHDEALRDWAELVRTSLDEDGSDEERADRFANTQLEAIRRASTAEGASRVHFSQIRDCWFGLARYWRRRGASIPR